MKELDDELYREAELKLINEFVRQFDGNSKVILEKIQKLFFFNEETVTYKRVPQRIRKNVIQMCEEYKSL